MKIEKNTQLAPFTTFKIGGPAQFFCAVTNEDELKEAVTFAKVNKFPIFVLGGGSNILISDEGFKGLVIKMEIMGTTFEGEKVTVHAGENWDAFVGLTLEKDLNGLENLSLIPGTVGAAPVQNIGAYGTEVKDTIDSVRAYDTKEELFKDLTNFDCTFEYRNSLFKKDPSRYIITAVTFHLKKDGKVNAKYRDIEDYFAAKNMQHPTPKEIRAAVIEIRTRKLPDVREVGTAGSFFKNPIIKKGSADDLKAKFPELPIYPHNEETVKVSLGWILDHVCNFKGVAKGDVGTYKNQALVLVNNGKATEKEIKAFAHEIEKIVKEKTGIEIEPEVLYIG